MALLPSRERKDVVETISSENNLTVCQNPDLVSFQTLFQIMISEPSIRAPVFNQKPNFTDFAMHSMQEVHKSVYEDHSKDYVELVAIS